MINRLRVWWQLRTGEEDTPFDGDTPAWMISMVIHLVAIVALGLWCVPKEEEPALLVMETAKQEEIKDEIVIDPLPKELKVSDDQLPQIGALSPTDGGDSADPQGDTLTSAEVLSDVVKVAAPTVEIPVVDFGALSAELAGESTGPRKGDRRTKGLAGVGTGGAMGAIDRITHEILMSLEERKTLVVWMFDQSGSLSRQRASIHQRFDRIFEELGIAEKIGHDGFTKHDEQPLLNMVMAFGQQVSFRLKEPTTNVTEIKAAVQSIQNDASGVEMAFTAVGTAADRFRRYRTGLAQRNVMIVMFSDEVGDDEQLADQATALCKKLSIPVYVVGIPAPFGREKALIRYVDPDPNFDQSDQWIAVRQGPESFMPERLQLAFAAKTDDSLEYIDSGFGPYTLTRLCVETGGIYFAVHANNTVEAGKRAQTEIMSARMDYHFDPKIMRDYGPDYISIEEYQKLLAASPCREALVKASQLSRVERLEAPRLNFPKRDEPDLKRLLDQAQLAAAKLEPKVAAVYNTLKIGEADRAKVTQKRWQAGYDLAMGCALAVKVRTEGYNAMLAEAKGGMKFKDPKNDTWVLEPANEITVGSALEKQRQQAETYLKRVVAEHDGTPWALLAKKELETPIGWRWTEKYTGVNKPRENPGNGNAPPPQDDVLKMLPKPKPKREGVKL